MRMTSKIYGSDLTDAAWTLVVIPSSGLGSNDSGTPISRLQEVHQAYDRLRGRPQFSFRI
jgi:hypothetical protein